MNSSQNYLISVVMPAYNAEKYINQAVRSVLGQTYSNIELIIIDDSSKDNTFEIMRGYADSDTRVRIYRNSKNCGVSYTRNFGVSVSNGDWIAFIDSDDVWTKEKLEKQLAYINCNPEAKIIFTGSSFIDENDQPIGNGYCLMVPDKINFRELLKQNLISCSSVLVRKECLQKFKMMNDDIHEDFAVWLRILKDEGYAIGINEPLLRYRMSGNSKSSNKLKAVKMTFGVYRFVGLSVFASLYYLVIYIVRSIRKYSHLRSLARA